MAPSRRRNNTASSLFESSTIITANLIMASSSYLLTRFSPRAPAATARPSAVHTTRSMEPIAAAGCTTVLMEPYYGGGEHDGVQVDKEAETFIKRFRERTHSDAIRQDAMAASTAAVHRPPPHSAVAATKRAGTVHRYHR